MVFRSQMREPIVIRSPRWLAYGLAAVLAVLVVTTVATWLDRGPGAAHGRADRYLTALVDGDAAGAWRELTDRARTIWGSLEAFESAVDAADWSTFEYEIRGTRCDDGICGVDLSIPGGIDSVPAMLYAGPTHFWWGSANSLVFSDKSVVAGAEAARRRGDTQGRIVVVEGWFPWDASGVG